MIPTRFRRWSSILAVISTALPAFVLVGWWQHIDFLKSPLPDLPTTNPISAIGLIFTSAAFYFIFKYQHGKLMPVGKLIAGIIFLLGLVKIGSLLHTSLPSVDQILFSDHIGRGYKNVSSNSMSVLTAVNFMLMGVILLLQRYKTALSHALAAFVILLTLFSVLGYAFRIPEFYHLDVLYPMSIYTAVCFLLLALAVLFAQPDKGWMKEFSSKYEGGSLSRVLLPIAILVPIGLGYLRLWLHWRQLISTELGVAILVSSIMIVFVGVVAHSVRRLNKRDEQQKKMLQQLELATSQSEANLKSILDATLDAFLLLNTNYDIVAFNESYRKLGAKMTGRDLAIGMSIFELIVPERKPVFLEMLDKVKRHEVVQYQMSYTVNNELVWLNTTITPVAVSGQEVTGFCITIYDITSMKRAEHVLQERENQILQLNSSLLDFQSAIYRSSIVSRADKTGIITFVNDNFVSISGYSEQELIGQNHHIINSGHHPKSFWIDMWKTISSGHVWRADVKNRAKDGSFYWVDTFIMPFLDEHGHVREFLSIRNDITYRVESTREIEKLSLVASKTSNAVTITDGNGLVEWVNAGFTEITGYSLEDARGQNMRFLQGPETDRATLLRISEKLKQHKPVSEELINYRKSGEKFWIKLSITPVFTEQGVLKNFISVQSDVSELKEYENSITSIARELASLIENANVPIFGIDAGGKINEWNRVAVSVLGYQKDQIMGASASLKILDAATRPMFDNIVHQVMSGSPAGAVELPVITNDKRKLTMLMSGSPRRNTSGQITGGIFVAQNITELTEYRQNLERKVTERTHELHEALSKERELVDMKSRFVSIASHEFRTPLSTISIATSLVRKHFHKLTPQEIDEKLQNVQKQVEHMSYMLDDVLLIEKANAGKLTVQKKEVDISLFFAELCREVEKSRGGTHTIRIHENLLVKNLLTDEKILRSIFINLLTNAIKFSPDANFVDLDLRGTSQSISIKVKDYGIGIPEEDIRNLFEPFFRGGNVSAIQGTGLGLSIIRKSLELVKGFITVTSKLGEGTEFNVTLPNQHG
jgi:PAS domain S-box-containing protein